MKIKLAALVTLVSFAGHAQGTVNFANLAGGLNLPVFHSDLVTKVTPPYLAGLMAGKDTNSLLLIATTPFSAGYFLGGTQSISTVAPGATAWLRVIVWNTNAGATFEEAQNSSGFTDPWGETGVFSLIAGDPSAPPPPLPLNQTTFTWGPSVGVPPSLKQIYDGNSHTISLWFTGTLQSSTDLVNWTNIGGVSPQILPANGANQYFRASQ